MKALQFSITISAPKETVWATLWQDASFRIWANFIDEGTYMQGVLEEGNEIAFLSAVNGYGVTSLVEKLRKNELLVLRHSADTKESGRRKRKKEWAGGLERYTLTEDAGLTTLLVELDTPKELETIIRQQFPPALACVKKLAEQAETAAVL